MSQLASFRARLAPLRTYLDDSSVTEIAVNRPGEAWLAVQGRRHMKRVEAPELSGQLLRSLAEVTASYTQQEVDTRRPLLSATIPINLEDGVAAIERGGYRLQVVLPPVVEAGSIGLSIRKPSVLDLKLQDYVAQGAFSDINTGDQDETYSDEQLLELFHARRWVDFLRGAVHAHKNIGICAGTDAGKSTFLNALLKEIALDERIVTIEDNSRELFPPQPNRLHLLYSRGLQGIAPITAVDLLEVVLRLNPDRAIMGELRGAEAYPFLELLNSGHSGSFFTIHADSPRLMFERLAQMVMRFDAPMKRDQIIEYARSLIQVVVQLKRGPDGVRYISEIQYEGG